MSNFMTSVRLLTRSFIASVILLFATLSVHAQSLIRDTEIEETLRIYGEPLIQAAGLNPDSVDIYIVNDPTLNAFVTRGQKVFFHTGILIEFENPNQLKGVMAHEVGHISGGHLARSSDVARSAYGTMLVAAGLGLAAILAGEGSAGAAIIGSSTQFATMDVLRYSRINESSADQAAANYLEMTGQSGVGLLDFFEKFRYQEVMSQQRRFPYFRSHPLSSDRIDSLREVVAESPYTEVVDSEEDIHRMKIMQAKLRGFLEPPQTIFRDFPAEDTSEYARLARSVAHFRAGNLKQALVNIDSLLEEFPDNPFYYELKGQIYFESGRVEESIPPLRKAIELLPNAPLIEIALAQSLIARDGSESSPEAIDLLKGALVRETENSYGWYMLSQAYGELGQDSLAHYAIAEQSYHQGDYVRARSFADRAMRELNPNIPQYRRASDIVAVSEVYLADRNRRR